MYLRNMMANCQPHFCVRRYVSEGTVLSNYADVLAILMRLRQHCCHPDLLAKTSPDLSTLLAQSPPSPVSPVGIALTCHAHLSPD